MLSKYVLILLCGIAPQTASASAMSLREAYLAALKRSETVGVQKELLVQASELEHQATSALFPNIMGSATFLKQQTPSGSTGNSISPSSQNTIKVTADQPLFRGFREFAAIRQRSALKGAQTFALQNAAKQLFYDLSAAFYNVLILTRDETNYKNEIEVNRKRLGELQSFLKIGRSRMSELLTFRSNISSLEAQLESTHAQLETAKDVLAFLTGWNRDTAIQDDDQAPSPGREISSYLARIEKRPDVKAAAENLKASEEGVPIARGAHLPSVDLIGDYYFDRPGAVSNVNWDVQLALTLPIFQGGAIESQARQAASVSRQYELLLSQTRRGAEEEIRSFYDAVKGDQKQLEKLSETLDWSKKNYEAELKDYRNGLVTNLEVLQAITSFQAAQRLLDRQRYTSKLDAVKLQAAAAERAEVNEFQASGERER